MSSRRRLVSAARTLSSESGIEKEHSLTQEEFTVNFIYGIAEELEAMPVVDGVLSPEAQADPDAYRARMDRITDRQREAEIAALLSIEGPVKEALDRVSARVDVLFGVKYWDPNGKKGDL